MLCLNLYLNVQQPSLSKLEKAVNDLILKQLWPLDNAFWKVVIRPNRSQHWKDGHNKILKKNNEENSNKCQICYIYNLSKALSNLEKCAHFIFCYKTGLWSLYTFSTMPSILYDNSKNVLFNCLWQLSFLNFTNLHKNACLKHYVQVQWQNFN